MTEADALRATVDMLPAQVRALAGQVEIMQLVAQYGPAVGSGSGRAAALWTGDGTSTPSRNGRCVAATTSSAWPTAKAISA